MIDLTSQLLQRRENAINRFIEAVLKDHVYRKKVIKRHFDKNLLMPEKMKKYFIQVISARYVIT